jgi:hypothetical protein
MVPSRDACYASLMSSDLQADGSTTARAVMRWVLAAFYAAAGIAHLLAPEALLAITPA